MRTGKPKNKKTATTTTVARLIRWPKLIDDWLVEAAERQGHKNLQAKVNEILRLAREADQANEKANAA